MLLRLWEYLCPTTEWQTAVVKWRRRILRRAEGYGKDLLVAGFHLLVASPAETTQDADPFELSASCVGVVS